MEVRSPIVPSAEVERGAAKLGFSGVEGEAILSETFD